MYVNGEGVTENTGQAMEWYKKSAKLNNSDAMVNLGDMYCKKGLPWYKQALDSYKNSANLNNKHAMITIGDMYCKGKYVDKDHVQAMKWYKSADLSESQSMEKIGDMYYNGYGVTQDYTKAMEIYTELCNGVFSDLLYLHIGIYNKLGDMYFHGYGTTQDYVKAMEMYKKSCKSTSPSSLFTDHSETYKKNRKYVL